MSDYIFPCKTTGKCRQLMFKEHGWDWSDSYPKFGGIRLERLTEYGFYQGLGNYKCCTQCHLPLNQAEATRVNKLLGNRLDDIIIDDDFLELLNGL